MELRLYMPDDLMPMEVDQAMVRWSQGREFGLQFLRMRPEEKERFHRFIGTFDRKPSP